MDPVQTFESHRPTLLTLAYRMLGDLGRAEDAVQDAWLRWQGQTAIVESPRAFLLTVVTRLCLNELDSARARREESRSDRLPEPVDLGDSGMARVERLDDVSMALLVVLQRLTPAERAALLLHDVFDLDHREIAALLQRSEAACRQLVTRARAKVASEKRAAETSTEEHHRLLRGFARALTEGDGAALFAMLAADATLVVDGGPDGARLGRARNFGRPIVGARKIAAVFASLGSRGLPGVLVECALNGQPAMVRVHEGRVVSATLLSIVDGRIARAFIQTDARRLTHLGRVGREALQT
ncbi:MAG: sigma-70 family RNA polymerase sigma factor, partial [Polyangiaceae bacterium]